MLRTLCLIALIGIPTIDCDARQHPTRSDAHGVEQVFVPAGAFTMGTADVDALTPPSWAARELASEQPAHEVRITNDFWIDRFEVTNAAFDVFAADGGYRRAEFWSPAGQAWLSAQNLDKLPIPCIDDAKPEQPRVCVTWFEADAYARWRGGRLPTEAEWEYAARGPESRRYPWGSDWDSTRANVTGLPGPVAVGSYPGGASWVGAEDMAGNAMEWVADWLDPAWYARSPVDDPVGPATGSIKVEKGGWWGSLPYVARSAYRHFEDPPTYQDHHISFRVVSRADGGLGAVERTRDQ